MNKLVLTLIAVLAITNSVLAHDISHIRQDLFKTALYNVNTSNIPKRKFDGDDVVNSARANWYSGGIVAKYLGENLYYIILEHNKTYYIVDKSGNLVFYDFIVLTNNKKGYPYKIYRHRVNGILDSAFYVKDRNVMYKFNNRQNLALTCHNSKYIPEQYNSRPAYCKSPQGQTVDISNYQASQYYFRFLNK